MPTAHGIGARESIGVPLHHLEATNRMGTGANPAPLGGGLAIMAIGTALASVDPAPGNREETDNATMRRDNIEAGPNEVAQCFATAMDDSDATVVETATAELNERAMVALG